MFERFTLDGGRQIHQMSSFKTFLKKFREFAQRLGKLVRPCVLMAHVVGFKTKQELTAQNSEIAVISQILNLANQIR